MAVKARFWVQKITSQKVSGGIVRQVELAPVIRSVGQPGDGENVDWSKYTPSGSITLNVTAEAAGEWFDARLGEDVSITFDDVDQ